MARWYPPKGLKEINMYKSTLVRWWLNNSIEIYYIDGLTHGQ